MLNHHVVETLAAQRQATLRAQAAQAAECRGAPVRHIFPRWRVSWSRTRLSPAAESGSSLVIIISASRLA
jgi:hypothetical protein